MRRSGVLWAVLACACALTCWAMASPALADDWLPHPPTAVWHYSWSDSAYNPSGTQEVVTVCSPAKLVSPCPTSAWSQAPGSFILGWASEHDPATVSPESGWMSFQESDGGFSAMNWSSSPPPVQMPILCPTAQGCANSLAGALYNVVWGARAPVLSEPLLAGLAWNGVGGAQDDVTSASQYIGQQPVVVPAFPRPVLADVVRSEISQPNAIGEPYGGGLRTTWWVRGVGPVKVIFEHSGGAGAAVTTVTLNSTTLTPAMPLPDANYFPMVVGQSARYRWTNAKHLPQPEVESVKTVSVANRTDEVSVTSISGPIRLRGLYGYSVQLNGVTNTFSDVSATTLVKLPRLGHKRHFLTPLDLLEFGFNPLLPAYPASGNTWSGARGTRDYAIYGVTGKTTVLGIQTVHVPAGTFHALAVRSALRQAGYRYGSGVRTSWFAAGRGLVKLQFRHADGSVSRVELLR